MKHKNLVTIIRKSCLTDKVVWIYRGPSEAAAKRAYYRARSKELERVRHWQEVTSRRRSNINALINYTLADLPITAVLTPEQKETLRQMQKICSQDIRCDTEFYDHIRALDHQKEIDRDIRREMRERNRQNRDYVK